MNKQELISKVMKVSEEKVGKITKKDYEVIVNSVFESISDELKQDREVRLVGFGTFKVANRAAREAHNPKNPEEKIHVPEKKAPVFKASKALKEKLNN